MPRRGNVPKREILPDPVYGSVLVMRLVNSVMLDGKKGVAQKVVYAAFDQIKEKTEKDPIEVFNQVLTQYLVPRQDIDAFSARLRQQNYRMIRRMSSAADSLESVASRLPEMGVQTMRLEAGSPLCGLSLAQSNLRREYAVTVVAVARSEQEVVASPPADFVMEAGDLLYLFGKTDKLFAVKPVICAAPATPATATAQEPHQA